MSLGTSMPFSGVESSLPEQQANVTEHSRNLALFVHDGSRQGIHCATMSYVYELSLFRILGIHQWCP